MQGLGVTDLGIWGWGFRILVLGPGFRIYVLGVMVVLGRFSGALLRGYAGIVGMNGL